MTGGAELLIVPAPDDKAVAGDYGLMQHRRFTVAIDHRFDETIIVQLKRDEAIVLFAYLHRELYGMADGKNLRASFVHDAEMHSLLALHQELFQPLMDIGAPGAEGIVPAAQEHLLQRHT
jgi:hypothetical protein